MSLYFKPFRRLALAANIFVLMLAACATMSPQKALAASCHFFNYSNTRGGFIEGSSQVNYTDQFIVPYTSACHDINLISMYPYEPEVGWMCANVRVRFFPSSGGNYANGWKWYCPNRTMVIATDVKDGTRYRLEFQSSHLVSGQVYD